MVSDQSTFLRRPLRFIVLQNTAFNNFYLGLRPSDIIAFERNLVDNVHSLGDSSEHNVFAIQPWCFPGTDKELRSIGIWSSFVMRKR